LFCGRPVLHKLGDKRRKIMLLFEIYEKIESLIASVDKTETQDITSAVQNIKNVNDHRSFHSTAPLPPQVI